MSLRHIRYVTVFACCLLALALLPFSPPSRAQAISPASSISITSQSTTINFPSSIIFRVSATDSSSTFASAEIVVDLQNYNGPETHQIAISAHQRSVSLTWNQGTTGNDFVTPGASINYYWRFTDSAGTTYFQPQRQLTTFDTRFNWQHLKRGLLQVNWYDRPVDFGQVILNQASASIDSISANLGAGLQKPINLWVYETDQDFHGSLPPGSFEWVGGIAFPMLNEASIVVQGPDDNTLIRDMPHELTHLVFHQLIASGNTVPTWFDEGLAVYNQKFHEQEMTARYNQALNNHALLRLGSISSGFPANSDLAYLAYAQSWQLLIYMYNTYGQAKMIQFIHKLNDPSLDFSQAMQAALGVDELRLEYQWRLSLKEPIALPPSELTPTPQVTPHATARANGTNSDDRSWVLIALGSVLVLGSFAGLLALFVIMSRGRRRSTYSSRTTAAGFTGINQGSTPPPHTDPAVYARDSMYLRPADSAPPQSSPPTPSGQGYAGQRPRYPQAPQE